jgi:hypothetical protein
MLPLSFSDSPHDFTAAVGVARPARVKRAADLALGVPGLVGWQLLGWEHLMPNYSQGARLRRKPISPRPRDP